MDGERYSMMRTTLRHLIHCTSPSQHYINAYLPASLCSLFEPADIEEEGNEEEEEEVVVVREEGRTRLEWPPPCGGKRRERRRGRTLGISKAIGAHPASVSHAYMEIMAWCIHL